MKIFILGIGELGQIFQGNRDTGSYPLGGPLFCCQSFGDVFPLTCDHLFILW